ncbi:MAG: ABC transporter substrate-binding protein, partial [Niameybacter sp.]
MLQKIYKVIFIVTCLGLLSGCFRTQTEPVPDETETQKVSEKEQPTQDTKDSVSKITIGMQNPVTLNPIYNMDKSVQQNLYLMFDTLVNIEEDGSVTPNVAKSWIYSEAEKSLVVTLREDIKWHDGQALTAEDVVFTLEAIQKATESPYKLTTQNMANVQVVNNTAFKIYYRQDFSGV